MMVVIASVHHTGTNFVWQHLLNGMTQVGMNYDPSGRNRPPKNAFVRIHCDFGQYQYLEWWCRQFPVIVPMRHPLTVAESWKARDKDLSPLPAQWNILKNEVHQYNPLYLPIDHPDREAWLDAIRRKLGIQIQTDWPVVMSCNKSAELTDEERADVVAVMADGFFDRFNYEV